MGEENNLGFCFYFRKSLLGFVLAHQWSWEHGDGKKKLALSNRTYAVVELLLKNGLDPNIEIFLFTELQKNFYFPVGFCFYVTSEIRMDLIELLVRFGADAGRSCERNKKRFCPLLELSEPLREKFLLEFGCTTTDAILTLCQERHKIDLMRILIDHYHCDYWELTKPEGFVLLASCDDVTALRAVQMLVFCGVFIPKIQIVFLGAEEIGATFAHSWSNIARIYTVDLGLKMEWRCCLALERIQRCRSNTRLSLRFAPLPRLCIEVRSEVKRLQTSDVLFFFCLLALFFRKTLFGCWLSLIELFLDSAEPSANIFDLS